MPLQVEPHILATIAAELSRTAHETADAVPRGWLTPAGADTGSTAAKRTSDRTLLALRTALAFALNKTQRTAYDIGTAATQYSTTDDDAGRALNGNGAPIIVNPVADQPITLSQEPPAASQAAGPVDPLTFARQLHTGPGTHASRQLAQDITTYLQGPHRQAITALAHAADQLEDWTPVGAAAATNIRSHRQQLDEVATGLAGVSRGILDYAAAFDSTLAKHPTPRELSQARQDLITALKSGDDIAIQQALTKYEQLKARSHETARDYFADIARSAPADEDTQTPPGGGQQQNSGGMSGLESMLPMLLSTMASDAFSPTADDAPISEDDLYVPEDYYPDEYLPSAPYPGYGSPGGPVPNDPSLTGAPLPSPSIAGPMPLVAAPAGSGNVAPRAPVIDAYGAPANTTAASNRAGSGYMPYMPMAPGGAPGGNGNDRGRVVAWHPDRLMYVDDTPHTDPVIGEKPAIVPAVTPPTAAAPAHHGGTP